MKEIKVYKDDQTGQLVTTSLNVAEVFGKSHKDVLKAIRSIIQKWNKLVPETLSDPPNFIEGTYVNKQNKHQTMFLLTKGGVALYITRDESLATLLTERCDMFEIMSNYVSQEKDNTSYIYLMKDRNRYKVGISRDVEMRLKSLRVGNPTIEMIYKSPILSISRARSVEANIISSFNNIGGEWFVNDGSDNEVVSKIRLLVG